MKLSSQPAPDAAFMRAIRRLHVPLVVVTRRFADAKEDVLANEVAKALATQAAGIGAVRPKVLPAVPATRDDDLTEDEERELFGRLDQFGSSDDGVRS